jgi:hypothetical protein
MKFALAVFVAATALAVGGAASAQTLYKLVDKQGKVTYSQEAPKHFDGTVTRIDVDPNANTATLPKYTPPAPAAAATPAKPGKATNAVSPQEKLERAKQALAEARDNPGPDDVRRVGNVGGGTRPVPTEAYTKRLADLERQVREAEEEVRRSR